MRTMRQLRRHARAIALTALFAGLAAVTSCSGSTTDADAPVTLDASVDASIAGRYSFVSAHPELIRQLPCYCGCMTADGHASLFDCYYDAQGGADLHASRCGVCLGEVDIAQALFARGADVAQIRATIEETFFR